ncbi:MAG: ATP-dependent sacrificial sulfur transferase LarE [Lachnospiraceae bacterium]|nr:ATP-dependent sacrificial sulfur transferase LarE [Lachnospiraceae bacterium]
MGHLTELRKLLDLKLYELLKKGDCCVAFSAGVDSTLVLKAACIQAQKLGRTVYAVTFQTMLHPKADKELALKLAEAYGAKPEILEVNEYEILQILENPPDRCFYCKDHLFAALKQFAQEKGCASVLDGTNADDKKVFRPGLMALDKNGIISPLAECGITKKQVRELAAELDLETASRPSSPCLATRLPYGTHLEKKLLERIESGEYFMQTLGFDASRLRIHGNVARIEVNPEDFEQLLLHREALVSGLKALGFVYITLDLQGLRSGSMDEVLSEELKAALIVSKGWGEN